MADDDVTVPTDGSAAGNIKVPVGRSAIDDPKTVYYKKDDHELPILPDVDPTELKEFMDGKAEPLLASDEAPTTPPSVETTERFHLKEIYRG